MEINKWGQELLRRGFRQGASDLYIFPTFSGYDLTFRYHQEKKLHQHVSQNAAEKLILYYKYLADMDVAEKRRVQVGAGQIKFGEVTRRLRFSTVGNFQNRESLVIRFLHDLSQAGHYNLFIPKQLTKLQQEIQRPGLFLFAGPTGSGKTTTMYHLAKSAAQENKQVITVEDPVELYAEEFLQLQLNHKIGLDYETLVKVCLRHRPDILIVGEIRDQQTAQAVIRGALTGHTIYSTIHGLNKESIIPRLLELGVEREELRQCLQGIIYQRLFPFKCAFCSGSCQVYCSYKESGVIFDTIFYTHEKEKTSAISSSWSKSLQQVWAAGYLKQSDLEKAY